MLGYDIPGEDLLLAFAINSGDGTKLGLHTYAYNEATCTEYPIEKCFYQSTEGSRILCGQLPGHLSGQRIVLKEENQNKQRNRLTLGHWPPIVYAQYVL